MIVLTYHSVRHVGRFESHVRYLTTNGYNFLSLSEFIERYERENFNRKDILMTFDDGDYTILEVALPVLIKYKCPAVLFVITSLIGTEQPFWWDEIMYYTKDGGRVREAKTLENA